MTSSIPAIPPTVLVVEDDQINQKLLAEVCQNEGYRVLVADDGETAFSLFLDQRVDLLLVDAAMPRMDGYALARLVRELGDVPVIMVTASMEKGAKERALEAGVTAFISKPFRLYELTRQIRSALSSVTRPSEPPEKKERRLYARVLDDLDASLPLRTTLSRVLFNGKKGACLLIRLENEEEIAGRVGRTARDAVLGYMGQGLKHGLGGAQLYWADSNELAAVVSSEQLDRVIPLLDSVVRDAQGFGIEGIDVRYGVVRFGGEEELEVDVVLQAVRKVLEDARCRGELGGVGDV